ncbi:phosphotransferase [Paenibacillus agricola]|uniref:Phosphotransferase n=1 Tax=Paenibacillus agricola TaxID=2716264 RepID=A0ABX0J1Q3_9BACL|nr:phosphotransferase [Paenibacillus agricola]NHN30200.1 phosphotransferase [Paenibacillus agricola]
MKDDKKSSLVVRLVTEKHLEYALKSLFLTPDRQQFITQTEQMLVQKGLEVAAPIPTLNGELSMIYKGAPYVLYEWIDGKQAQLHHPDHLGAIVKMMAKFHHISRSLIFPPHIKIEAPPDRWKEYEQRRQTMKHWLRKHKNSETPIDDIIKDYIPFFCKIAKKALKGLRKASASYEHDIRKVYTCESLVHGDLHHCNVIYRKGTGKPTMIDFEDVRYDLPSKDLLRIFSMYKKYTPFNKKEFIYMMKTYERNNPLSPEVKNLVYIDMLFPHIFERMLRKKIYKKKSAQIIKKQIKREKDKAICVYQNYFKQKGHEMEGQL